MPDLEKDLVSRNAVSFWGISVLSEVSVSNFSRTVLNFKVHLSEKFYNNA